MKHIITKVSNGFILPATILLGLGVSIVSATFVQYIISSSGALNAQSYNIIAEEAAYSGLSYALSCIAAASTGWTTLSPERTCSGVVDAGTQPSLSRAPSGEWTSTFRVNSYNPNTDKKVTAVGVVRLSSGAEITTTRNFTVTNALRQVPVPIASNKAVTDISSDTHSCVIANGQLYCWGVNNVGQLGDGTTVDKADPTRVMAFDGMMVTKVAVGTGNSCAVADGQLYCWGDNTNGQLGIGVVGGSPSYRTTPQAVLNPTILTDFKVTSISLSQSSPSRKSACAVANGITFCWGDNSDGQLGQYSKMSRWWGVETIDDTATRTRPTPVWGYRSGDASTYDKPLYGKKSTSVSVGASQGCNVANGIFHCWGEAVFTSSRPVSDYRNSGDYNGAPLAQPWSALVVEQGFCSINDYPICRGLGIFNDNGTHALRGSPDRIGSFLIKGITSYDSDDWPSDDEGVLCVVAGGWTWCRGHRDYVGALGLFGSPVRNPTSPTGIYLRSVSKVGVGSRYGCIVTNGGLACWGRTTRGQLASGLMTDNKTVPEITGYPIIGVDQTATNWQHEFVATGPLGVGDGFRCTTANSVLFCWGSNTQGRLGTGTPSSQGQPTMTSPDNLLNFTITNPDDPSDSFVAPFTAVERIASGDNHSCMITATLQSPTLYCWGDNTYGQLGIGNTASRDKPTQVRTNSLLAPDSWISTRSVTEVSAGPRNTCAIADSRLYCWGDRSTGIVHSSSLSGIENTPVLIRAFESSDYHVTDISVGESHACAIVNGDAYCWGNNTNCATARTPCTGRTAIYCDNLFTSCTTVRNNAKVTTGTAATNYGNLNGGAVTKITAGNGFTCAIINGTVSCWGKSNYGQTGTGGTSDVSVPTAIATTAGTLQADTVSAGDNHACAVLQARVYCWGDNTNGKLGDNSNTTRHSPVPVTGGAMSDRATINVVAGKDGTCSVSNGSVLCWGAGLAGQIGDNGWAHRSTPTLISGYRMSGECETFNCSGPLY